MAIGYGTTSGPGAATHSVLSRVRLQAQQKRELAAREKAMKRELAWNVGKGDTFLSALRTTMFDPVDGKIIYNFFGTTNGCAVQPGDKVTVIWEIIYN